MNESYSPVILSKDEIELVNIIRSTEDKEVTSTIIELLRQLYKMDWEYRFEAIRSVMNIYDDYSRQKKIENAINCGKRYRCTDTPKAQFGNLRIFNTKNINLEDYHERNLCRKNYQR